MKRRLLVPPFLALALLPTGAAAGILFESGTLGPTGLSQGSVVATNVTPFVYTGVRFHLTQAVITEAVGGHFVSSSSGTFFGAIVALDDANDFPDSGNLSTPDVLGAATLTFPNPSAEVEGDLTLSLDPGWYTLVFGSGLFGTNGDGATPQNNPDISERSYIAYQPGSGVTWIEISPVFKDHRFVLSGRVVPEPTAVVLLITGFLSSLLNRSRIRRMAQ